MRKEKTKYTCQDFGHDCPVFYLAENVSEELLEKPPDNEKDNLKDDIKRWRWYNNKAIVVKDAEKPCYSLGMCPYGSLGDNFKIRKIKKKYECKIFNHDCPIFYHFEFGYG